MNPAAERAPCSPDEGWSAWPAPAKLNLFLHVIGRRADGYHDLQTVFQLLDWGDTLNFKIRADGAIGRVGLLPGVAIEDDLSVRAANALRARCGVSLGVDIAIDKRIPQGGGLGGGSSDAATALVALNRIWNAGLGQDELAAIALTLGADVPVFVRGRSAWAEGVGERLTPVDLPERWFVVIDPGVRVQTVDLFQAPDLTRNSARLTISNFVSGVATTNVFEPVVRARFPEVARAIDWLNRHAIARLSGSGGCIFAQVTSRERGMQIVDQCPNGIRGFLARGVAQSPLLRRSNQWPAAMSYGWGVAKW